MLTCVCGDPEEAHHPDCENCGCRHFELARHGDDDRRVESGE